MKGEKLREPRGGKGGGRKGAKDEKAAALCSRARGAALGRARLRSEKLPKTLGTAAIVSHAWASRIAGYGIMAATRARRLLRAGRYEMHPTAPPPSARPVEGQAVRAREGPSSDWPARYPVAEGEPLRLRRYTRARYTTTGLRGGP